jgi:diaminopimelate decarboxylase/aspartate kinase
LSDAAPAWWRVRRTSLLDAAAEGTPTYVMHAPTVRRQVEALARIASIDAIFYAMKANSHPDVLRVIANAGCGFECVSPGELARAREVAPGAPRLFTPNFASRDELRAGFDAGATVTLDGAEPARLWTDDYAGRDVFLRVDPGRGRGHHAKVRTAGAASKFGLDERDVDEVVRRLAGVGARVSGLHAHAGSGVRDAGSWREIGLFLANVARRLPDVRTLDVGGGLYVPDRPGRRPFDRVSFARALAAVRAAAPGVALWVEPGRFLVAEAGVLLCRVTQRKDKAGIRYVGVDAGMNTLLRPALYGAWHDVVNLSRLDEPDADVVSVVGPICESGDVLAAERRLPRCEVGDVLLFDRAGAYGAAMSSTYNLRAAPREVTLDDETG